MKQYVVFLKDVGFLPKQLRLLYQAKEYCVLRSAPPYLNEAFSQYEERSGNVFCYCLEEQEISLYDAVYVLQENHLTRLYQGKRLLR